MPTFQPSRQSFQNYGFDEDAYSAQQMLTSYRSGASLGSAEASGKAGVDAAVSPEKKKGSGFLDTLTKLVGAGASVVQSSQGGNIFDPPECKKPVGSLLWGRNKKIAWQAECDAARAASVSVPVSEPVPQGGTSLVWIGVGGLVIVGLVGGWYYVKSQGD